ncbi:erythroferrone [Echinops telfairi]|uniref:Erythroferrone n=1 Tax=Echinops telfairi TaxID=9371 RepID=A0ABM0ZQ60_ECHTE|nr:erythroferrone [Echinops telfairi]
MAPGHPRVGAQPLLVCGLLAAAVATGLVSPQPGARAPPEPLPGNELPAGPGEGRAGPATSPAEPTTKQAHAVDPRDSWMFFLQQSDRGVNSRRRSRGKARKPKLGLPGPPGPPGPQGPPGAIVTSEVLLREFQQLLKDALRQREDVDPEPVTLHPTTSVPEDLEEAAAADSVLALLTTRLRSESLRVTAAFCCHLHWDTPVEGHSLHQLGHYQVLVTEHPFSRGPGLNLTSGRYTAPVGGFYSFSAALHVAFAVGPRPPLARDYLRLLVCIQSQCQHHSLETVVGLAHSSDLFTIATSGVLFLQSGQYTSVFVDNVSSAPLTVCSGSRFSAVLLGV